MKLQILIPHYKESLSILKPLLDSIAIQQNVDFSEVGVIISNDAKGEPFKELPEYPFEIIQVQAELPGVSAARNKALDSATADYVMFCDADDMFYSVCAFYIIFNEIAIGFDSLTSCFIEETRHPETKQVLYIDHKIDSTFVHGKVHRRQYLIDNKIRWNPNLTIHEDSFFNIQCQELSTNVKYCPNPFYLWKWRDDSVCRHDPKYILKTYRNMIDSNNALVDEFLKRGLMNKAAAYVVFLVFDAYYIMNKPEWVNQENKEYRDLTEKYFSTYFKNRKSLWESVPAQEKMMMSNSIRTRVVQEGMMMEAITMDDWLKKIESLT